MTWVTTVAEAFVSLLNSETTDPALCDIYARALMDELTRRDGTSLYAEALSKLAPVAVRLSQEDAPAAGSLSGYIAARSGTLGLDEQIRVHATITTGTCYTDPIRGERQFDQLLNWVESLLAQKIRVQASTMAAMIVQLDAASGPLGDRITRLVERVQRLVNGYAKGDDAIVVRGALCLIETQHDCQAARHAMERLLPEVEALAAAQPGALYLTRMIADLIGRRAGDNEPQARAADSLARAVVRCAHRCPAEASQVLEQVIGRAVGIRNKGDRAQALIDIFSKLADGPSGWPPLMESVLSSALQRAQLDAELAHPVFEASIAALCDKGDTDGAERLANQADSAQLIEDLLVTVRAARERLALGKLSSFEREFNGTGDHGLALAVLHSVKVENDSANVLQFLADALVFEQWGTARVRLLSDFLPSAAAPLRKLNGTGEIGRLISEVAAFDSAFVTAAQIIGQGSAKT